ncbi:MAG: hypothetical protein IJG45_02085, partial [Oscillospiraceae bacterium]|nr:hypothetical protein [Oscillospiraceae bacterium]
LSMIGILSDHYGQVKSSHEFALSFTQEFSLAVLASQIFDILKQLFSFQNCPRCSCFSLFNLQGTPLLSQPIQKAV